MMMKLNSRTRGAIAMMSGGGESRSPRKRLSPNPLQNYPLLRRNIFMSFRIVLW